MHGQQRIAHVHTTGVVLMTGLGFIHEYRTADITITACAIQDPYVLILLSNGELLLLTLNADGNSFNEKFIEQDENDKVCF
jgi:hypothetical protein